MLDVPNFTRALWLVGWTGSGKSTVAREFSDSATIIETGQWVRSWHAPGATAEELSFSAIEALGKDHRCFSNMIGGALGKCVGRVIVVGARNPTDFVDHFDPQRDAVAFLRGGSPATEFERIGIAAIKAHVKFLVSFGICSAMQAAEI